jgi:hypothetical protein
MLKKLIVISSFLAIVGLTSPVVLHAADTQTCTTITQYGGSVSYICGAHTPVETGIADSLPLIGSLSLGASGILLYISKKINKKGI